MRLRVLFAEALRSIAANLSTTLASALSVLIGVFLKNDVFFESALLIAMMGFVGTVSLAKYVSGRNVIE